MASSQLMIINEDVNRYKMKKMRRGRRGGERKEKLASKIRFNASFSDTSSKHTDDSDFSILCPTELAPRTVFNTVLGQAVPAGVYRVPFKILICSDLFCLLEQDQTAVDHTYANTRSPQRKCFSLSLSPVSYTHLTLPTRRTV